MNQTENEMSTRALAYASLPPFDLRLEEPASYGLISGAMDCVANVAALHGGSYGEITEVMGKEIAEGICAQVMSLEPGNVGLSVLPTLYGNLDAGRKVVGQSLVRTKGVLASACFSSKQFGRSINSVGECVDGMEPIQPDCYLPLEAPALGVLERYPVNEPLHTGLIAIDTLIPIGLGQREGLLGDRRSGKTETLLTIMNTQRVVDSGVRPIYVMIGQKSSSIASSISSLRERGMYQNTIAISVCASDSPLMRSLAPRTGCAVAEHLCREYGYDTLIMHDTLTSHANAYSELSLLLRRLPGRDGLPADIFYTHARILERAGRFRDFKGSITAIPVVDLDNGDLSEYLPTNIVSITDGQAVFLAELFSEGKKPALDATQSVSRLGGSVQPPALRKPSSLLKLQLTQIQGVRRISGVSTDVDSDTKATLKRGLILDEILKQDINESYSPKKTLYYILAGCSGALDSLSEEEVRPTLCRLFELVDLSLIDNALAEGRELHRTEIDTITADTQKAVSEVRLASRESGECKESRLISM